MRFTLKDYQVDAVGDVLDRVGRGREDWQTRREPSAFSLTATTGAGKTVMAAAVIEALFEDNDDFDFDADPGAVVLWFTDDPALNQQTRFRLMEAGDRVASSRLVVIENDFNQERLEPGNVYFLNAQKLGKKSLLVRGAAQEPLPGSGIGVQDELEGYSTSAPPDARQFTMWDTLRNTIEDERLTLYLILDEAHRGMKDTTKSERTERQTIVRRLINGTNGIPPVPVVWGISATVERFNAAMQAAEGRTSYPSVVVDPARVQESGLLKDDIRLDFPADSGKFDTVLLARAVRKVVDATTMWEKYARAQDPPVDPVSPLLVVQVPNTPPADLMRAAVTTIADAWPDLPEDAIAHVLGEHKPLEIAGRTIPYVSPETVQDREHIRILLAKDAISTGWDCPRAEVLVSFRPAKDQTHITQLLGRMVRTPLARRIPGDDRLNSVECVLPHFNRKTATEVAEVLLGERDGGDDGTGGSGGGSGRRVLIAPADMDPNGAIPAAVWEAFDRLPSQTLPRKAARPVRRLTAIAQALSRDKIREGAVSEGYEYLMEVLDGRSARLKKKVEAERDAILEVEGETLVARVGGGDREAEQFSEIADERAVDAYYRAAARLLTPEVARRYADRIANADEGDDGLFEAHLTVAALARVDDVPAYLDEEADKRAREWIEEYRVAIKGLSDERRADYDEIIAMSRDPPRIEMRRPEVRTEETKDAEGDELPTEAGHLMSDAEGQFPIGKLNDPEKRVLATELRRGDFLGWYRNPSRASADALAVAYLDGTGNWRRMCPDFVFFHGSKADVRASIVDPHGHHLGDALPKLRGLAGFAAEFGDEFLRVDALSEMKDKGKTLRVLDLQKESVRDSVMAADDVEQLYLSDVAADYR